MIMIVSLAILIVLAAIMCTLAYLAEDPSNGYRARHRAPGRVSWPAEVSMHLRRQVDRAKRAAFLRLMVIPADPEPEPLYAALPATVLELDAVPVDHRWDVLAPRALAAHAHLRRKGLRLRTAAPTPLPDDIWESELVGAA